jgi:Activator of Hsp90 ATPase homolog 1-like protein
VFSAINDVRGWWSGEIEGDTNSLGDEFTYRYEDIHYSKQKITEFVPNDKVVWHIVDSYLKFVDDQSEWNDTEVIFDVSEKGGQTVVTFTHQGLVPAFECFGACSNAWGFYINESLRNLIATGKGDPNS